MAACICLFSLDKHAAIPVDTHVWQLALRHYTPQLRGKALSPKLHGAVQRHNRLAGPCRAGHPGRPCVVALHQLPLVGGAVETVYSDEPPMYAAVTIGKNMTVVHSDAFLDRRPARMHKDAERGNWY